MSLKFKIKNPNLEYELYQRKVKNVRLEVKEGSVKLIVPQHIFNHEEIIRMNQDWILNKISRYNELEEKSTGLKIDFERTDAEFKKIIIDYIHEVLIQKNLRVNRITIRRMKSRWGSCSSKGNISINSRLKYLPLVLIKYVAFHEITHLIERKHNPAFWKLLSEEFENYKELKEQLAIYWIKVKELP